MSSAAHTASPVRSLLLSLLTIDARSRHGFERKDELRTRLSSPFYQYVERSRRVSTIEIEINFKECREPPGQAVSPPCPMARWNLARDLASLVEMIAVHQGSLATAPRVFRAVRRLSGQNRIFWDYFPRDGHRPAPRICFTRWRFGCSCGMGPYDVVITYISWLRLPMRSSY